MTSIYFFFDWISYSNCSCFLFLSISCIWLVWLSNYVFIDLILSFRRDSSSKVLYLSRSSLCSFSFWISILLISSTFLLFSLSLQRGSLLFKSLKKFFFASSNCCLLLAKRSFEYVDSRVSWTLFSNYSFLAAFLSLLLSILLSSSLISL